MGVGPMIPGNGEVKMKVEMKVEMDAPILQSNHMGRKAPLDT